MDAEYRRRLSEEVKRARGTRSQRQFAKALGVSYPAVRSWEECESLPGLENLELIAESLGQSLEEFLAHLRGEQEPGREKEYRAAEDLLPLLRQLSKAEQARLIHLLVDLLAVD